MYSSIHLSNDYNLSFLYCSEAFDPLNKSVSSQFLHSKGFVAANTAIDPFVFQFKLSLQSWCHCSASARHQEEQTPYFNLITREKKALPSELGKILWKQTWVNKFSLYNLLLNKLSAKRSISACVFNKVQFLDPGGWSGRLQLLSSTFYLIVFVVFIKSAASSGFQAETGPPLKHYEWTLLAGFPWGLTWNPVDQTEISQSSAGLWIKTQCSLFLLCHDRKNRLLSFWLYAFVLELFVFIIYCHSCFLWAELEIIYMHF